MSDYILGGWSQLLTSKPPSSFSYAMYGMITNLKGLTSGTPASPGWSPAKTQAPAASGARVMWTYGGGGCTPTGMPSDESEIQGIVDATREKAWAGVDFDDECGMDVGKVLNTMQALRPNQVSYTFLAGWDYNNPSASALGRAINDAVQRVARAGTANRQILMCYAAAMWPMSDIVANVGPAIQRTIDNGVPAKEVILALTPAGLDSENLNYFLGQVTSNGIGGLFVWNYPSLSSADLRTIEAALGITA